MAAEQETNMHPDNGQRTIQASYYEEPPPTETQPQQPPSFRPATTVMVIAVIAVVLALFAFALGGLAFLHSSKTGGSTSASISTLDQSQTRFAGEVSAQRQQITSLHRVVAADSSALSALRAKVDDDISCADLAKMKLLETTGGSVSSVPGSVDLSQSPVPLPKPCTPGG